MDRLTCVLGLAAFVAFAWLLSFDRRRFPWRMVLAGLGLQALLGWLLLRTAAGRAVFAAAGKAFDHLLGFANEGVSMVFGPLANRELLVEKLGTANAFIFVVTVTGTIVFVSALSSLLYHYGILQVIVRGAAWAMRKVMRTSGSESLAAAANIFMGQTEAPLVVKPYLPRMTRSELMALMTGGMSTIAGGVFAAYVAFGIDAGHLLTASVMSAPAALMMAKILCPEREVSETASGASAQVERPALNGLDALCHGASDGIRLAGNVMAMLIAFVATVALVNALLALGLRLVGVAQPQPLQWLLGWINAPFAWLMGVPGKDALAVGQILGERVVLNEFMGYISLAQAKESIDPRSLMLTTYALCGFANFSSIAIQIGGISTLAPERRGELASLGLRAMVGGLLACYCTAAMAGLLARGNG
jgi:CNT family concentrative nucleoside transporter